MGSFLNETLDWVNYADSHDVVGFVKGLLGCLGWDELQCLKVILNKRRTKISSAKSESKQWKGARAVTTNKLEAAAGSVCQPSQDVLPPETAAVFKPSPFEVSEDTYRNKSRHGGHWWEDYEEDDIVAFDVEAVPVFKGYLDENEKMPLKHTRYVNPEPLNKKAVPKAAILAVVDYNRKVTLNLRIKHMKGTFDINHYTKRTNGITVNTMLENGTPYYDAIQEFAEKNDRKLQITCGGGSDYGFMQLLPSKYHRFDLQSFYQRTSKQNPNVLEAMSLRDIYFHHFKEDIQRGEHNALIDAKATMKIFRFGYKDICDEQVNFDEFPSLREYEKKNLFYCKIKRDFVPKCSCRVCNEIETL